MNAPADHADAPPRRGRVRRWASSAAGVLAALVVCELGLRQLSEVPPPYVPVALDTPRDPMHERRIYYEGIARSHFSPAHSRLTGGAWMAGAPVGVIVGDSHVEAVQVFDRATMGAVAERGLRARGNPVNVRQYGRAGYSAPEVVLEAPEILRRWNPAWVVVVLADNDLDRNAMTGSTRFEIRPDTSFSIHRDPPGPPPAGVRRLWRRAYTFATRSSALGYMTLIRARRMLAGPRPPQEPLRPGDPGYALRRLVPAVTVRSLRQAYGDRLHIIYLPDVGVTPERDQRLFEAPFLAACRAEGVPCTSLYPAMAQARDRDGRLTRGFMNTAPAAAHLNVHGHRLAGEAIVRAVGR